uniref:CBF1-interacting co-repressor CIR N-terminal domain-containing protein n=1 Tax=Pinguiococcus pyrenoidosus TaxID=172671 RepID=A0A7R9Y7F2_9STRA|mmetsp:Transcript_10384/g.39288  ORF Transcript_10384/g.39288 Transcript_10384/m.39288 type:complete len:394 (+) Transcript_10384:43-1224(+)
MPNLSFLSKKSWNVSNLDNVEKVWLAEKKKDEERKKLDELRKQIAEEAEAAELRRLQEEAGLAPKRKERVDFLYEAPQARAGPTPEEYLLGKEIKAETLAQATAPAPEAEPRWVEKQTESNEKFSRLHEDPLFEMRRAEKRAREEAEKRRRLREAAGFVDGAAADRRGEAVDHRSGKRVKKEKKAKKDKKEKKHKKDKKDKKRRRREEEDGSPGEEEKGEEKEEKRERERMEHKRRRRTHYDDFEREREEEKERMDQRRYRRRRDDLELRDREERKDTRDDRERWGPPFGSRDYRPKNIGRGDVKKRMHDRLSDEARAELRAQMQATAAVHAVKRARVLTEDAKGGEAETAAAPSDGDPSFLRDLNKSVYLDSSVDLSDRIKQSRHWMRNERD